MTPAAQVFQIESATGRREIFSRKSDRKKVPPLSRQSKWNGFQMGRWYIITKPGTPKQKDLPGKKSKSKNLKFKIRVF